MAGRGPGRGPGRVLGRSRCCPFFLFASLLLLLLLPSVARAFLLLSSSRRGGLRLTTRRFGLDNPGSPLTAPTASHSIVSRPFGGLYCRKCGETMNFKTNCGPTAAEKADAHTLELVKINATAMENEAQRAAAHALELVKITATAKENAKNITAMAKENAKNITATAKENNKRNATSLLIGCLSLAVVCFFSREVAGWVKTTVVPLLNSTRERPIGVIGFLAGKIFK